MKKIKMTKADIGKFIEELAVKLSQEKGIPEKVTWELNPDVKLKDEEKVEVIFETEAYEKMQALIEEAKKEIGWYGVVEREGDKTFIIKDLLLCPQVVTGATVKTDDKEYIGWLDSLDDYTVNHMRFYGHSHVNMSTFPSSTDKTHYNEMIQNCNDFYIFGIFNKSGARWFNIYDVENNILYEDSDIKYQFYISPSNTWATEQIKKYVKEETYTYNKKEDKPWYKDWQKNYNYGGYSGYEFD